MKLLIISDTHGKHLEISPKYVSNPNNDISTIICCGDISTRGYRHEIVYFLDWYSKLPFKNKILIAGNHDFYFERAPLDDISKLLSEYPSIIYLNDSGVEIDGIKFWGSPVTPYFYNWAFNRLGTDICPHWDMIPSDTQVLITHGPIRGYLDRTIKGDYAGCPYLLEKVVSLKNLSISCWGHIHEAYGIFKLADGKTLVNASVLDEKYEVVNKPIEIEI